MATEKRLIDANAFRSSIKSWKISKIPKGELLWDLDHQPTVDAVEVVRCKNCKHGIWDEENEMWKCVYSATFDDDISEWLGFYDYNQADHFCSYGAKRDSDGNG